MVYDVVVVGAGSAGATLATRLATESERSVLLIEAGPDYPLLDDVPDDLKRGTPSGTVLQIGDVHNWGFVARASARREDMPVPRGKVTGGSSSINGQIFLRGLPEDYDSWVAAGNPGWSFDEILPFLQRAEHDLRFDGPIHGTDGPIGVRRYHGEELLPGHQAFYEACRAIGFADCPDANEPESTGVGPYPLNNENDVRTSTAIAYLPLARNRPNFTLWPNTLVRRVLFEGTRAIGVEVDRDGEHIVVEAGEVVLAAGAVGSPQLLMLSGVGPRDQLSDVGIDTLVESPGVGAHLLDHPTAYLSWQCAPGRGVPPGSPLVQMTLRYTADDSDLRNDMYVCPLTWADAMLMVPGVHGPRSQGQLRLVSEDLSVQPALDFALLSDPEDLRRMREAVRLCLRIAEQDAFRDLLGARLTPTDDEVATDDALDDWLLRVVDTSHHISGTCKMGPDSDPLAVVDAACRVKGTSGLRVVDASVLPEIPRANTNVTSIMIGEKLAALMLTERAGAPAPRLETSR